MNKKMRNKYKILLSVCLFYLIFILLFISKFDFNISSTIELSEYHTDVYNSKLPDNLIIQINSDGYDGQFYYLMSINPTWYKIEKIDPHFLQRILYPLFAYLFALGNKSLIPWSLLLINLFSIVVGTYILILILNKYKSKLNMVYLWAFNIGFLICIIRDLTSPLMFLFVLLSIYCIENKHFKLSSLFLSFAILTRETTLLIIFPILLFYLIKKDFKKTAIFSFPLLVFFVWQFLLFIKLGHVPILLHSSRMDFPFIGLIKYISWIKFPKSLNECYLYFSIFPILFFSFIQVYVICKSKKKNITIYSLVLIFQLIFMFSLKLNIYTQEIGGVGRFAIALLLFSILYSAERKEKYNVLLIIISLLMSLGYFIVKIIIFHVEYLIS